MKVMIHSYDTCCQNKSGGVQVRIRKIEELLRNAGVETEFFSTFSSDIGNCDIVHTFLASPTSDGIISSAHKAGKKVVLSSIMPVVDGWKIVVSRMFWKLHLLTQAQMVANTLCAADCVIAETEMESEFLQKYYSVKKERIVVIPNGVDVPEVIVKGSDAIFERIGGKKKYILQVGRFDDNKNQLNVIKALKDTDIDVVFVGGADRADNGYYAKCLQEAKGCDNIHFLGWVDNKSTLLRSAYQNAEVLTVPSHFETFGLTLLEGGMAGNKLAISKTLPILEYPAFLGCRTFAPDNVVEIRESLRAAFTDPKDELLPQKLEACFSWPKVIEKHIEIYKSLIV